MLFDIAISANIFSEWCHFWFFWKYVATLFKWKTLYFITFFEFKMLKAIKDSVVHVAPSMIYTKKVSIFKMVTGKISKL